MAEAVNLIYDNLSSEWESFITQLEQMASLLKQSLIVESLEQALIVEEAKRKTKESEKEKGEEKALVGHKRNRNFRRGRRQISKFDGDRHNCGKYGHKVADCWSKKSQESNENKEKSQVLRLVARESAKDSER
jgi:hypothetical protein